MKCNGCGIEKLIDEFHCDSKAKNKRQTRCKLCRNAREVKRQLKYPLGKIRARF